MTLSAALQVVLLAPDPDIVAAIDQCIDCSQILIPTTEVRRSRLRAPFLNWANAHFECSRLGTRVVGIDEDTDPNARLKRLVVAIHKSEADTNQLRWRLRSIQGTSIGEKLEKFIMSQKPNDTIRTFAFTSEEKLEAALAHIGAPHLLTANFNEEALEKKVLWRLGFEQADFESRMNTLRNLLNDLRHAAQGTDTATGWKERVRSIGVNLFVYLEEILDETLCFSTWLLLSDHFASEHTYDSEKARRLVASELSGLIAGKNGPIVLDAWTK